MSYFDCGLSIGQSIKNADLSRIYKCGNMGGMRRSKETNTLVIVTDFTKDVYHDKWIGGTLHYTGMGKNGDQRLDWAQNKTLAESKYNDVDVHLFEVLDEGNYIFCGHVQLVGEIYQDTQLSEDGVNRLVWIFPVRPVPENNVVKMELFTFKDMDDYKARGKSAEEEFKKLIAARKKKMPRITEPKRTPPDITPPPPIPVKPPKPLFTVPSDLAGRTIRHKAFGQGVIVSQTDSGIITVKFSSVGEKNLGYQTCIEHKLIEIV